jgi:GH25 family lysozyme M1 (1,4-beta-N-acetylmuramidase)
VTGWLERLEHGHGEHEAGAAPLLPGCDVSNWNGSPADWRTDAGRISWAGVKVIEVAWQDGKLMALASPDAAADWAFLRNNGMGRVGYLFAHPDTPAAATAQMFAAQITGLGLEDGDGIAIDLEVTGGKPAAEVAAWAGQVAQLLESGLHRVPLLYTFLSFAEDGNCAGLARLPLWIADPSSPRGHPRVPGPWKTWALSQYVITGPLDRDVAAFADLAAMRAAIGKKAPAGEYVTTGRESLVEAGKEHGGVGASYILRLTLEADGRFSPDLAAYLDAGRLLAPMPAKITLRVPAAKG